MYIIHTMCLLSLDSNIDIKKSEFTQELKISILLETIYAI